MTSDPAISLKEYAGRRRKLLTGLGKSAGIVFAGDATGALDEVFRPHPHFEYLTGVVDEPVFESLRNAGQVIFGAA